MQSLIFLAVRIIHVLMAALWLGSTVFIAFLLTPAVDESGPAGGQVMAKISRGITGYMAVLASTTVLTGVYLLWRFTGGFSSAVIITHAGLAFAAGGSSGVLASLVGGGVVARNAGKVVSVMSRAMTLAEGPARHSLLAEAMQARRRAKAGTHAVIALQTAALVLMTIGHYV
jgi:uncharacterized membrane protein